MRQKQAEPEVDLRAWGAYVVGHHAQTLRLWQRSQGQLQLNPCAHYHLQEKLFAPAATAAFHDQAIAAGMLLQQ